MSRRNPAQGYANRTSTSQTTGDHASSRTSNRDSDQPTQAPRLNLPDLIYPRPQKLSVWSAPPVPNSGWCSQNFMFGAGMVIIQPSSGKIVVVFDRQTETYFLPRGRKDVGESLEATALREGFEESGYQAEFMPLWTPTEAPSPPSNPRARHEKNTEPVYVTLTSWRPSKPGRRGRRQGGEYIVSWYIGQIPEDAVRQEGTGMPDEQSYTSELYDYKEAYDLVYGSEKDVVRYAYAVYQYSLGIDEDIEHELAAMNATSGSQRRASTRSRTSEERPASTEPPSD